MKGDITTHTISLNFEHVEPINSTANLMGKFLYRYKLRKQAEI